MKSVNTILAWGHARVIENLMGQRHRMNPPPVRAISDQFAYSKDTVAKALMSLGREIELIQNTAPKKIWLLRRRRSLPATNLSHAWAPWKSSMAWCSPKALRLPWMPR